MSTERRQREGLLDGNGEPDPLVSALNEALDKCSAELGVSGCDRCPVKRKCDRLWPMPGRRNINLTEYRRLNQKFALLKQERDCILAKRGQGVPQRLA